MELQDSQSMISGYAYDDNYKIRLSDDVKANEEMKEEWMNEEMDSSLKWKNIWMQIAWNSMPVRPN